jgi:hypothetical protein
MGRMTKVILFVLIYTTCCPGTFFKKTKKPKPKILIGAYIIRRNAELVRSSANVMDYYCRLPCGRRARNNNESKKKKEEMGEIVSETVSRLVTIVSH